MAGGKKNHATADGRDRLSNLPDCLIHAILSRLDYRQAVQTCVLARRWPRLWCGAITCINIDSANFSTHEGGHRVSPGAKEEALARLEDFADNLLLRRGLEPPLDALLLRVHGAGLRGDINVGRWVRRGLKMSPAALDVSGGDGQPINLDFLSSSVSVSGGGAGRLTRLRLDNVLLHYDFEDLLGSGGLPVLQDLQIINAVIVSGIWRIASDTLTSLAVVDASCRRHSRCSVDIVAPHLTSLRLDFPQGRLSSVQFNIIVDGRASLVDASVRLLEDDGDDPDDNISDLCFLLKSLSSVTSLHLSGFQQTKQMLLQEVLDHVACSWTSVLSFPNLTSLVLEDCELGDDTQTLWSFLHTTPAISRLFLNSCKWRRTRSDQKEDLEIEELVPNLKLLRAIGGDGKKDHTFSPLIEAATLLRGGESSPRARRSHMTVFPEQELTPRTPPHANPNTTSSTAFMTTHQDASFSTEVVE
nr:MEIOTIC F-BOX protein MOF-like [Lolium perenne]